MVGWERGDTHAPWPHPKTDSLPPFDREASGKVVKREQYIAVAVVVTGPRHLLVLLTRGRERADDGLVMVVRSCMVLSETSNTPSHAACSIMINHHDQSSSLPSSSLPPSSIPMHHHASYVVDEK